MGDKTPRDRDGVPVPRSNSESGHRYLFYDSGLKCWTCDIKREGVRYRKRSKSFKVVEQFRDETLAEDLGE